MSNTDPSNVPPPPPAPVAQQVVYAPAQRTNTLAIVGFVLAFFVSIAAVICGHIALSQIKRTGEGGHGLALAAVIIGYVGIAIGIIYFIVIIALVASGSFSSSLYQ
jgi:hypothetical protein